MSHHLTSTETSSTMLLLTAQFVFTKLVCCSSAIIEHIKRAYYQCPLWYSAPNAQNVYHDPANYGYKVNENSKLILLIITRESKPNDLTDPCK